MVRIARHRDSMLIIIVVAVVSVACVSACTNERQHSNCAHHSHSPEREKNVQNKNEIALCCCLLLLLLNVCVRWSIVSFLFHWFVTSIRTQTYYHQLFLSLSLSLSHSLKLFLLMVGADVGVDGCFTIESRVFVFFSSSSSSSLSSGLQQTDGSRFGKCYRLVTT